MTIDGTRAQRRMWMGLAALFTVAATGCGHKRFDYAYKKEPDPIRNEYRVGPSDVLKIVVWRDEALSGEAFVRPDGITTLPLLGDIRAAGKTPTEIQKEISDKLSKYMEAERAVVTVSVLHANSYFFTVSGNVARPGRYTTGTYVTVIEAVALAGEPTAYARLTGVVILRRTEGGPARRIPINYESLQLAESDDDLTQNLVVITGDVIVVP
jgi:polysaccharide export outer membrane protein